MRRRGEAEGRRQPGLDALPAPSAIVAAVHATMVLLVEPLRPAGGHHHAVHALAGLGIALVLRQIVAARAPVACLPGDAAVAGVEHAGGRDPDPKLPRVGGMRHERVENEAAPARLPLRTRGMPAQAGEVGPVTAAGLAPEQAGRLDPGMNQLALRLDAPCSANRGIAFRVDEPRARVRPGRAEIGRLPDCRSEPLVATGGVDRARRRVGLEVVDRPRLTIGPAQPPVTSRRITVEDERAFARPDQDQQPLGHASPRSCEPSMSGPA